MTNQEIELLRKVLEYNYQYYVRQGMNKAHMYPEELLNEFLSKKSKNIEAMIELIDKNIEELTNPVGCETDKKPSCL